MTEILSSHSEKRLAGIVAACLTPFDRSGTVDNAALERQIEFMLPDADAISIAAVEASEYSALDPVARAELLRTGARIVAGRKPVVLGASSPNLRTVGQLAELAAQEGAAFVQVLAPARPWGGEPDPGEILDYFHAVETISPLPLVAYHNPACGADPSVDTWVRISEIPGVKAIKESSRNLTKIGLMIEQVDKAGNASYLTTMQPLLSTILLGGSGGTMPPPGTRIGAQVVEAVRGGDLQRALAWQRVFNSFPGRWARYGLPPVMKAAMRHFDVDLGDPLPPYSAVTSKDDAEISEFLRRTGIRDGLGRPRL